MKVERVVWWWLLLSSASIVHADPFLKGKVSDEQGRPIVGASVKIWDCVGTCLGGKTVLTDAEGHYVFEKKPFQNYPSLSIFLPGRYEVSRRQTGPELHEPDSSTPRRVDFVLGTPAAATVRLQGEVPDGWTQRLVIRSGRDVELHRYDFQSKIVVGRDDWNFEMLPRNENLHLVVAREPIVEESDDPKDTKERRRQSWRNRVEIISPAIRLTDPQRYDVRATVARDTENETSYIIVESVIDAVGADRTEELTVKDPTFGPTVDAATGEKALALLRRVESTAVPWNAAPSRDIVSYEYDAINATAKTTHVKINQHSPSGPAWSDIARRRGFAYMPPLRWLFSQPENIVFHGVELNEDRAILHYRLKSIRGFGAGLGVGPDWNGFFTRRFSTGTIVIDTKTATVLEHRLSNGLLGEESVETFRDYVAVGQGYAPRSLRIKSGDQDFRLAFRIHNNKLWLLDHAFQGEEQQPAVKIENVVVTLAR